MVEQAYIDATTVHQEKIGRKTLLAAKGHIDDSGIPQDLVEVARGATNRGQIGGSLQWFASTFKRRQTFWSWGMTPDGHVDTRQEARWVTRQQYEGRRRR